MVSSQVIGEFALIRDTKTQLFSTNDSPNNKRAIATVSSALDGAVTEPINGLSE